MAANNVSLNRIENVAVAVALAVYCRLICFGGGSGGDGAETIVEHLFQPPPIQQANKLS